MSDCIFCKIVSGEISKSFAYQDNNFLAFDDIHPKAPTHVLVITKKHIPTINDASPEDEALLGKYILAAREVAVRTGIAQDGYRLIVNCGKNGGQMVNHLHMHVLGGRKMGSKGEEL